MQDDIVPVSEIFRLQGADELKEADAEKAEDEPVEESEEFDYNSMVAEVARRVALRLVKENSRKRK